MLSTENPPSPDPSCSCSPQLIKSSGNNLCGDEKASHYNDKLLQLKVDLSESGFDYDYDSSKPLSNFSIRDYVFSTRDKDIKTHWPFSTKKLQLCLKHGVKDVLPPFETLECVRINPVEDLSNPDLKATCLSDNLLSVSSSNIDHRKLASDLVSIKSIRSEEYKEYRSTTRSQSCSDNISSVQIIKSPSKPKTITPGLKIPASNKGSSNTQNKRCSLLVKLSNISVPQSTKDTMKIPVAADTMFSKVCPVCKTFLSSSNTTLNAHIDQCLSGGPRSNRMENSKVIKHRIKPRKTRLMVDIYATALHCTLEDLDRRNGTNWASTSDPAQHLDVNSSVRAKVNDEKNGPFASMEFSDEDLEGSVYVDSTGTKLRILSKFNDLRSNDNAADDCNTMKKLVKGDKGTNFLARRKKSPVQNLKLLKPSSHNVIPDDHCHKITDGDQRNVSSKQGCKKWDPKHHNELCDQVKPGDLGMVKRWVGSKRTVLKKKDNLEHESHRISKTMKNLRVKTSLSKVRDKFGKGTIESFSPLSAGSRKRKENLSFHSCNEHIERPRLRMRKELNYYGKNSHLMNSTCKDPEANASSRNDQDIRTNVTSGLKADASFTRSRMSKHQTLSFGTKDFGNLENTHLDQKTVFRSRKLSSAEKNLSSVKHRSASESNKTFGKRRLGLRKRKLCYVSDSDDEAIMLRSEDGRQANLVETSHGEELSNKSSDSGFMNLKSQKKTWGLVNSGKSGGLASPGFIKPLRSNSHCDVRNADCCVDDDITAGTSDANDAVQTHEEIALGPTCPLVDAGTISAFDNSLDSSLPQIPHPSYTECTPQHYVKAGDEVTEAGLLLQGEQETIPTKNDHDFLISNSNALVEIDANEGHGNYYVDIDPIPIPGPPGSFLPSPRHMGSDELQGISSLTTCRLPSSEDEHEVVGMDSSDSPISATSIVSNSIADGSNSASLMYSSMQSSRVCDEARRDSPDAKIGGTVEKSTHNVSDHDAERKEEFDESRTNIMSTHSFNNSKPCCSSKKDGDFQTSPLGYQESQLLKRRNLSSIPLFPVEENQMDGDANNELDSSKSRSEVVRVKEPNSSMLHGKGLVSHGYYESPSPSTPNHVLRLMGKNLMVVNKEENPSPQTRPFSTTENEHMVPQCFNNQSQHSSFSNNSNQGTSVCNNAPSFNPARHIDYGSSNGLRTHAGFMSPVLFPPQGFSENYTSSFEGREYSVGFNQTSDQLAYNIEMNASRIYESEKVQTHVRTRPKELIVIDDSTEHDVMNLSHLKPVHRDGGVLAPTSSSALGNDTRNASTFYVSQTQNHLMYGGTQLGHKTYVEVPCFFEMYGNLEKPNRTPQSSTRVLHPNTYIASSHLSGHPRSSSSLSFAAGFSMHKNFS